MIRPMETPGGGSAALRGSAAAPARGGRLSRAWRTARGLRILWAAAVLVPLLAFGAGAWWLWRGVEAEARARVARTADVLHEQALRAFEAQETVLTVVGRAARGMGWDEIQASRELHGLMSDLDRGTAALSGIGLVRPDGRMVAAAARFPLEPVDVSDREYFRAVRAGAAGSFVGEVVVSRPRNVPVFSLSRARPGAEGAFDGVIVTAFAPEFFSDFFAEVAESPGDAVVLARLDGALLARFPPVEDWDSRAARAGRVLTLAARPPGRGIVVTRSVVDGKDRLYAVRRLAGYPAAVAYGLDLAVMRAAWWRQLAVVGAICGLAAALLLLLTAFAQRAARLERAALAHAAAAAEAARAEAERRAEAEARLRQTERIGALGQVTAGVAHDFRNIVQAVQSGARLMTEHAAEPAVVRRLAGMMAEAAGRGARLTGRMLDFARREDRVTETVDVAAALERVGELLDRVLGRGVHLRREVAPDLPAAARGDRHEFETAVVNLVANARDAMPEGGGQVTITAGVEDVPEGAAHPAGLAAGRYVRVAVADTGAGMAPEVLARAGEAFFTTKPRGQGTGLGLAMARGFAEGAGGGMRVASAVGRGTTVTLWLPAAEAVTVRPEED